MKYALCVLYFQFIVWIAVVWMCGLWITEYWHSIVVLLMTKQACKYCTSLEYVNTAHKMYPTCDFMFYQIKYIVIFS